MFIDSHTHLFLPEFNEDREEMIQRALDAGVEKLFLPNIDSSTVDAMLNLTKQFPANCFATMGLHPCSVKENFEEELKIVEENLFGATVSLQGQETRLPTSTFFAIGEMGLDFYWDKTFVEEQKESFRRQARWAKQLKLPIIIHSRDAAQACIDLVKELKDENLTGVFHCFGGTVSEAKQIIDLGFYLGIGGVLTFKKSGLDETLREIDLKNMVLETDSPYLAPVPYRGKRNESSYLRLIAEKLAALKNVALEEVGEVTTMNAERLFLI